MAMDVRGGEDLGSRHVMRRGYEDLGTQTLMDIGLEGVKDDVVDRRSWAGV